MSTTNVVGQVSKPGPEELVKMYETFDGGQSSEIRRQFREGALTTEHVQALIEHRNPFAVQDKDTGLVSVKTIEDQVREWQSFYQELGITLDPSGLMIPERKPGFDRLIVVAKGMTNNRAYDECKKRFSCWKYTNDLDKAVPTNDRDAKDGTYALWIRDRVEADEELKNQSADDLTEANIKGITLLERLLYELKYFTETGKHLDKKTVTLCSGSRRAGGGVPRADWYRGGLEIRWRYASSRLADLRSRAVSL